MFRALACALMSMVAIPGGAHARQGKAEKAAVKRINQLRTRSGLPPVRADHRLAEAADAHSRDMVSSGFFDHASSDGTSTVDRILHFRRSQVVGETLAWTPVGAGAPAREVVRMWRRSPPHLSVLTTGGFRRIGVARRRGTLNGRAVTYWTADLATRR